MKKIKRKIIAQGLGGRTIFLPIKWIRENNLDTGDDVEISFEESGDLILSNIKKLRQPKEIFLEIEDVRKVSTRMIITNAYRAGFDIIKVKFRGNYKQIEEIVKNHLIGFEVTKKNDIYLLESISEPNFGDFDKIILRLFHIINDLMSSNFNDFSKEQVFKIQRYDNFLKRSISLGIFTLQSRQFMWQFLSNLAQISRILFHFNNDLVKKEMELGKNEKIIFDKCKKMFSILMKAYLKKDISSLQELHKFEQEIVREDGEEILKKTNKKIFYDLLSLARMIYLSQSPLTGFIQMQRLSNFK